MGSKTLKELWEAAKEKGFTEQEITEKLAIFTVGYLGKLDKPERDSLALKMLEAVKLVIDDFDDREMSEEDLKEFDLLLDPEIKQLYYEFFKELM